MSERVTCECGYVTEVSADRPDEVLVDIQRPCPACGRTLVFRQSASPRTFQQLWQTHVSGGEVETISARKSSDHGAQSNQTSDSPSRRSLWDVMRGSMGLTRERTAPLTQEARPEDVLATASSQLDAPKPKGLWGVMNAATPSISDKYDSLAELPKDAQAGTSIAAALVPPDLQSRTVQVVTPEPSAEKKYAQAASLASMSHVASTWQPEADVEAFDDERTWSRRAVTAVLLGGLAVTVSALSYRPEWWWRGPALIIGMVAMLLGIIAAGDIRRSRGRLKGRWTARLSVVLGSIGMFLSPIVFARWGEQQRENAGREEIQWRLQRIGQALDQFHSQEAHYPEAAIKGRDSHGDKVPMHGWMTPLLPSLGYGAIYQRIDLKQPYDAPTNVAAMQQTIPEFMLPGRKPSRSSRGFALTHFSGVGGQDVREPTGLVHLGLFNDKGPVRREDFSDGLGQTIIVGEIRDAFPAWGEPSNVRSIGEGLNRQFRGFGNANGTGATFLHADGSVKFYSNKVDRRVLEQLETRDGGERE